MPLSNPLLSNAGMSLIEVSVGMVLGAIVLVGIAAFLGQTNNDAVQTRAIFARDELLMRIRQNLTQPKALLKSADHNVDLKNCLNGTTYSCQHATVVDFSLWDSVGQQISGAGESQPFYYDLKGAICGTAPTKSDCLIKVSTSFRPYCRAIDRNSSGKCMFAEYIELLFTLDSAVDSTGKMYFSKFSGIVYFNHADSGLVP